MFSELFPIDYNQFHFLRPKFIWLLIPVGVVFLLGWLAIRQDVRWKKAIAPHLRPFVIKKGTENLRFWMNIWLTVLLALGVVALSGPTWKKVELPGQQLETPLIIVLDLSQSMLSRDIQPNRLERAKFKIHDLLDADPGARTALIGFAGTAHTIVPLCYDYEIIHRHLDGLKPDVMPFPGSNLQAALQLADSLLKVTRAPGTLLILSDDFTDQHFSLLQRYVQSSPQKLLVLPVNTIGGADVPSPSGHGNLKNKKGEVVRSALATGVLNQINSLQQVEVRSLTLDKSDVESISADIRARLEFTDKPEAKENEWRDAGLLLVVPMVLIVLLWFRKGWVLYALVPLFVGGCADDHTFKDLWYTRNYQGQLQAKHENWEQAALLYDDPLRKGVAYYKAGRFEEAISAFSMDTTAMGAFNLGLAYLQNGDTLAAKMAFGMSFTLDSTLQQARTNANQLAQLSVGEEGANPDEASEAPPQGGGQNQQNDGMENLGGGGQQATQKDMEKDRLEETVNTDIHKGKELEEVPDDIGASIQQQSTKILMRKVDDDPALFLKRKFSYQAKQKNMNPPVNEEPW